MSATIKQEINHRNYENDEVSLLVLQLDKDSNHNNIPDHLRIQITFNLNSWQTFAGVKNLSKWLSDQIEYIENNFDKNGNKIRINE